MKFQKKHLLWPIVTSSLVMSVVTFSTSCNSSTPESNNSDSNKNEIVNNSASNKAFNKNVDNFVKSLDLKPKSKYASLYANKDNWPFEKLTNEYFEGFPKATKDNNLFVAFTGISSYNAKDGEIKVNLTFQDFEDYDNSTTRTVSIKGFEKEPARSIINRMYGDESIQISPKWKEIAEDQQAIKSYWTKDKITSEYFDGLPQKSNGIEPKLAEVICNDSDLGQMKLKYDLYFDNQKITTKTYTISGFQIEDFQIKVERLYGNTKIEAREGAKKFSAIAEVWTLNKITNSWFKGLPKDEEGVNVTVKEVITNQDLESNGSIQIVFTFSKDGESVDRTYEVDGFYKDPDVAISNFYIAEKKFRELKLRKDIQDVSKYKLKDIANRDSKVFNELFDIPNIPYVSIADLKVLSWRNWKEGDEKIPAGSFKLQFTLRNDSNNETKIVTTKLFYGFEDVLGVWGEQFIHKNNYGTLVANEKYISWRQFYTGKGKGGSWDYSYNNILPATGQQNSVWIPLILPDVPDGALSNASNRQKYEKIQTKQKQLDADLDVLKKYKFKEQVLTVTNMDEQFIYFQMYQDHAFAYKYYKQNNLSAKGIDKKQFFESLRYENGSKFDLTQMNNNPEFWDRLDKIYDTIFDRDHVNWTLIGNIEDFWEDNLDILSKYISPDEYSKMFDKYGYKYNISFYWEDKLFIEKGEYYDYFGFYSELDKVITKRIEEVEFRSTCLYVMGGMILDMIVDVVLPFDIFLLPVMQSKSYLPVLADIEGQYRYTAMTALDDAKYAFGYETINRSRYDQMVTYDLKENNSLTWKDYVSKSSKGATEALRKSITSYNYSESTLNGQRKQLKFDSIKYVSYEGTSDQYKKLANGFDYYMGHTDAYWFESKFMYEVTYDGESIKVPFIMRLGTIDGLEQDSDFVIGSDSDLTTSKYNTWKG